MKVLVTAVQGRLGQDGRDWSQVHYVDSSASIDPTIQGLPTVKLQCSKAQADKIAQLVPAVYDFNVGVEFRFGKNDAVLKSFELIKPADEIVLTRDGFVSLDLFKPAPSRSSAAASSVSAAK